MTSARPAHDKPHLPRCRTGLQAALARLARDTAEEILTFMPGGAQSPAALRSARRNDSRLLEHGVSIRTIGLDSIRNDPAALAQARFLTDADAQFRTTPLLPPRMILADGAPRGWQPLRGRAQSRPARLAVGQSWPGPDSARFSSVRTQSAEQSATTPSASRTRRVTCTFSRNRRSCVTSSSVPS
jgi:hypothetical protein